MSQITAIRCMCRLPKRELRVRPRKQIFHYPEPEALISIIKSVIPVQPYLLFRHKADKKRINMKKITFIVISVCVLLNPFNAESGSVFWDINGDSRIGLEEVIYALQSTAEIRTEKKAGLSDAIYVLQILAGLEGVAEGTSIFKTYRADVLEQLQRTAKDESAYLSEFNEYTTTLSDRLPNVCISSHVPGVKLDISVSQDKRYFKLTASHENIKSYVWSLDSKWEFRENGQIISDGIWTYGMSEVEAAPIYRTEVLESLIRVVKNEAAYLPEYSKYTDNLSDLGYDLFFPHINIQIIVDGGYFRLKVTHDKLPGYVWTLDSQEMKIRENGNILVLEPTTTDLCQKYFHVTSCAKQVLGTIAKNEQAYYSEHQIYTDKRSEVWIGMIGCFDELIIEIQLGNNGQSYIAKSTHPMLDYVWTINEKLELVKIPK